MNDARFCMRLPQTALDFADYEDAVAAAAAKKAKCAYIIIRNKRDFANSPAPALTPGEFQTL